MEPRNPSSDLSVHRENYAEKAWHFAAVLLSIGRPVRPVELSGNCSLFVSSPEFVEFLCSMPNSPIFMSGNGAVFLSLTAFKAAIEFFAMSVPKVPVGGDGVRMLRGGDVVRTYFRKRKKRCGSADLAPVVVKKRAVSSGNEVKRTSVCSSESIVRSCFQVADLQTAHVDRALNALPFSWSTKAVMLENFRSNMVASPLMVIPNARLLGNQLRTDEDERSEEKHNKTLVDIDHWSLRIEEHDKHKLNATVSDMTDIDREKNTAPLLECLAEISAMLDQNEDDQTNLMSKIDISGLCAELGLQNEITLLEPEAVINATGYSRIDQVQETVTKDSAEWQLMDNGLQRGEKLPIGFCERDILPKDESWQTNIETSISKMQLVKKELINTHVGCKPPLSADPESSGQKSRKSLSATVMNLPKVELTKDQQKPSKSLGQGKVDTVSKKPSDQKDCNELNVKHKLKQIVRNSGSVREKRNIIHKSSKDQQESKSFPQFESYIVEEEEGSGGYGTVYRARRKNDGVAFAVKCPHANAHKNHVKNELRMLERFGGKNFVIKYEGSIKSGGADCFVLEHVEHDRPEVLKREINVYQLQWYGYCMFRALASLHKQGVFHRDVKPGNFLFTCKTNKGYLIDFNLAKDLHQKHENNDKLRTSNLTSIQHIPALQSKSVSPNKRRRILGTKPSETFNAAASCSKTESKTLKRKTLDKLKAYDDLGRQKSITSQGADASGLTSAKDITPSAERLREPLPCRGRKELINLAQEAMQSPNTVAASIPASNRKRVAASPGIIDKKLVYPTPMPLHSSGVAVSGAGSLKSRGELKTQKDGPCVGTKGFRAPEVLLRSLHQGPKVDVWSAGVTLLYLITGRLAFTGDPEQNMKEIVKLRGNEELWEVAKLHNRESSFPVDLLDIRYVQSTKLRDWCVANTKRRDFIELIPASLFDLIEKCLTVNPRLRISAEDALRHEFFAPCHEALHKHRLLRRGPSRDSRGNSLSLVPEASTAQSVRPPYKELTSPVKF